MTRVLLFGASGFLGGPIRSALDDDSRITDLTCLGRDRCDLVTGSLADLVEVLRDIGPDVVVNAAGRLTGDGVELMVGNAVVTAKLIEAIAIAAPGIRLVRLGSAGEYGQVPRGRAVGEDDPADPVGEYGLSHLTATRLVCLASHAGRVDGLALRVFNPVGAGCGGENLLGRAAARLKEALGTGADRIVLGPLGAYRDFVDTRDVATAVVSAVVAPALAYRVLNVGSGRAVTARHAVELLARTAGFTGRIVEHDQGSVRSATVGYIRADITRIGAALGWAPGCDLETSIKAIWDAQIAQ
jgi:NDP-hexose 4-ketoreductase